MSEDIAADLVWDILELDLGTERFYIQLINDIKPRDIPAFILLPPHNPLNPYKSYWVLFMNRVGLIGKYQTRQKALKALEKIVKKAKEPLKIWRKPIGTHRFDKEPIFRVV